MGGTKTSGSKADSTANIGFEAKLWLAADSRSAAETAEGNPNNNMDAADWSGATKPERIGHSPASFPPDKPGQTAAGSPKGERGDMKHEAHGRAFNGRKDEGGFLLRGAVRVEAVAIVDLLDGRPLIGTEVADTAPELRYFNATNRQATLAGWGCSTSSSTFCAARREKGGLLNSHTS